jgi:hypothetical protein
MENIFNINRESNFKNGIVDSVPVGNNNIVINRKSNNDFRREDINSNKPKLSGNKVFMPSSKKVPMDTFSSISNTKKNINGNSSSDMSNDTNESSSGSDELLSNNNNSNDDDDDEDDYSTINDERPSKSKNKNNSNSTEEDDSEDDDDDDDDEEEESDEEDSQPKKTYEDIQKEKQQYLFELERLQKQGYAPSKRYSMASAIEELKFERDRLKKQRDVEKSINFSRKILLGAISGIEYLNKTIDNPLDLRLNGWSENVMENVSDYDEVFEELHDKYGEKVKMAPELKLLMLVAGSGFMFHLTNSLFKSATPDLKDVLRQNPDIMRNIQEAASKKMSDNIGQQFGDDDKIGNMMRQGINMKMNSQPMPRPSNNFQQKMNDPSGVDELLSELNSGRDDISVSSNETSSVIMSSSRRNKKNKKGIQLTF